MNFRNWMLVLIFIATIWACPYCAGQSGQNYVQQVIIPIGGLLLAPFLIMGSVKLIIYLIKNNQK